MTMSVQEQVDIRVTGRRVVATLLDGVVLGLAYGLVAWAFGTVTTSGPYSWTAETSTGPTLLYLLCAFAYFVLFEGYRGQTLGKMVVGVRVVNEQTGQLPGLERPRFVRSCGLWTGCWATSSPGSSFWCRRVANGSATWLHTPL